MIIAVDVDQTVVNTIDLWFNYIEQKNGVVYNDRVFLEKYTDFWKNPNLYDNLEPYTPALHFLNILATQHKIWFISSCYDEHVNSKLVFLKKFFKFNEFINESKKNKYENNFDFIIDDQNHVLQSMKEREKCIQISYSKDKPGYYKRMNWGEIYNYILDL